jgi:hypothetical protein
MYQRKPVFKSFCPSHHKKHGQHFIAGGLPAICSIVKIDTAL